MSYTRKPWDWESLMREWTLDPQQHSTLLTLLPPEIRENIWRRVFDFQLPRYTNVTHFEPSYRVRYSHDDVGHEDDELRGESSGLGSSGVELPWNYTRYYQEGESGIRPDIDAYSESLSWKDYDTSILLTCRQIFLESRSLPIRGHEEFLDSDNYYDPSVGFSRNVVNKRVFLCEQRLYYCLSIRDFSMVVHLRITIRGTPSTNITRLRDASLGIHPFSRPPVDSKNWRRWYAKARSLDPEELDPHDNRDPTSKIWGGQTVNMPCLQTLVIDFDAPAYRLEELTLVVEQAQRWRFPLDSARHRDGCHFLSAEGNVPEKMSWRTDWSEWPPYCPKCYVFPEKYDLRYDDYETDEGCGKHEAMSKLIEKGFGLRMCSFTLTFTPRKCNEQDVHEAYCSLGRENEFCGGFTVGDHGIKSSATAEPLSTEIEAASEDDSRDFEKGAAYKAPRKSVAHLFNSDGRLLKRSQRKRLEEQGKL